MTWNSCYNTSVRFKNISFLKDVLEIQADAIQKGQKVVVIDDLLATGGKLHTFLMWCYYQTWAWQFQFNSIQFIHTILKILTLYIVRKEYNNKEKEKKMEINSLVGSVQWSVELSFGADHRYIMRGNKWGLINDFNWRAAGFPQKRKRKRKHFEFKLLYKENFLWDSQTRPTGKVTLTAIHFACPW